MCKSDLLCKASLHLDKCMLSGSAGGGGSTAISATINTAMGLSVEPPAVIARPVFLESFAVGFEVADETNIEVTMPYFVGAVGTLVSPLGSKDAQALITQRTLRLDGVPDNTDGAPPGIAASTALSPANVDAALAYQQMFAEATARRLYRPRLVRAR